MDNISKVVVISDGYSGLRIRELFSKTSLPIAALNLEKETLIQCDKKIPQDTILATNASTSS